MLPETARLRRRMDLIGFMIVSSRLETGSTVVPVSNRQEWTWRPALPVESAVDLEASAQISRLETGPTLADWKPAPH